jgi:hypothetical protein
MRPCDLAVLVTGDPESCDLASGPTTQASLKISPYALLTDGKWNSIFAQDGILILKHRSPGQPLNNVLPPAFYSFVNSSPGQVPAGGPLAQVGPYLQLEGFAIDRRERANLRNPDVLVTTWWKVLKPLPATARLMHYLTDSTGALQVFSDDQPATSWLPMSRWQPGAIYKVTSDQLTIANQTSGHADVDIGFTINHGDYLEIGDNEPVQVLGQHGSVLAVANGRLLKLTSLPVHM